jgi:hypothetical protein
MSKIPFRVRSISSALAALIATSLTGCGALSPYQHMAMTGPRVISANPDSGTPTSATEPKSATPLAGDIETALQDIEAQRQALFDKLDASAVRRSLGASSLYAIGGWAVLNGMKPNPTDADALRTTRLAVAGSTLYLGADYSINTSQEDIHARTYNALTCLVAQSKPLTWTLTQALDPNKSIAISDATPSDATVEKINPVRSRDELDRALDRLEEQINLSYAHFEAFTRNERWDQFAPNVNRAIEQRNKALNLARTALREGRILLQEIDQSGRTLRNRAAMIMAAANVDLRAQQKELPAADSQLTALKTLVDNFKNVGKQTEADDTATGADTGTGTDTESKPPAGLATGSGNTPPTSATTGEPTTVTAPASAPVTQDDLTRLKDALTQLIVDKNAQQAALNDVKAQAAAKQARDKEMDQLKAEADKLKQRLSACAQPKGPTCRSDGDVNTLIQQTNLLHAIRRPVAAALVNFRQTVREVSAHNACQSAPQWVTITPGDARSLKVPGVLEFAISAAVGGIPRVGLTGNTGSTPSHQALIVRADNGVLMARITLPADTPAGELTLWATDALGRHGQQVTITVTN